MWKTWETFRCNAITNCPKNQKLLAKMGKKEETCISFRNLDLVSRASALAVTMNLVPGDGPLPLRYAKTCRNKVNKLKSLRTEFNLWMLSVRDACALLSVSDSLWLLQQWASFQLAWGQCFFLARNTHSLWVCISLRCRRVAWTEVESTELVPQGRQGAQLCA